jgi:hypothetical protein
MRELRVGKSVLTDGLVVQEDGVVTTTVDEIRVGLLGLSNGSTVGITCVLVPHGLSGSMSDLMAYSP